MRPNKFLEKFLPDYKEKRQALNIRENGRSRSSDIVEELMILKYFPEALQNFADRICEKQRDYSLQEWGISAVGETNEEINKRVKQPKIDEL
jgi:hypothetical protein